MVSKIIEKLKETSEELDTEIKHCSMALNMGEKCRAQNARRFIQEAITVLLESDKKY